MDDCVFLAQGSMPGIAWRFCGPCEEEKEEEEEEEDEQEDEQEEEKHSAGASRMTDTHKVRGKKEKMAALVCPWEGHERHFNM